MINSISRRKLLTRAVQLSIGGALASAVVEAAGAADSACVDLKAMDPGELSTRNAVHWTAMSSDQTKTCSGCAFFTATSGGCGSCMIFNAPTYATGYCDSWAAKQA